ncbi:TetR/AcrR family transcriptional regulator [Siccibacter turicensis]|uniref:TetR/AcrR family transcriptional regulator n=1 Tax=Siccibacter turicensis TaxID=357233 RepID=UPI002A6A22F5|nr:TetR/AcrR family transcriptional regulator [Siccibacter turicensis]MDY0972296.1 TetR/AcrR family transcriptional regulator [Siccibacter turicensis]
MRKREDIIDAAERLFYSNGFHATSTDRICSEAGVSTRTFYRYFPSRGALTEAVMDARKRRFFAALYPAAQPDAIPQLFAVLASWMQDYGTGGCFFLKVWGEYAEQDPRLCALALDFRYQLREYITAATAQACPQDNGATADAVWMLFEGAITSALIVGPVAARQAAAAAAVLMSASQARP